ncbi:glutamate synthase-related protein [Streptomyces hyaluromycini]|uniref:Glutamate synthase-related protein n=1 Tax=Streptomyces hyaluromycini TaxID=1377993 RepID=A0ABV1X8Q5_9ACTN
MTGLSAPGFPEAEVRRRARLGAAAAFPDPDAYGQVLLGAAPAAPADTIDAMRIVPPVLMPQRLSRLLDLGREPTYRDVELDTVVGGFPSRLPVYLSALGSTRAASGDLGLAVALAAGRAGVPMVIGENVVPTHGYRPDGGAHDGVLLARLRAYAESAPEGVGGVVVQQSTEDADAEVWNLAYSDPAATTLLADGRLAFELKVGQGAKPGLGGMSVLPRTEGAEIAGQYLIDDLFGPDRPEVLRSSSPGTFTEEILRQQIRLMYNNFPRARIWVKLPPGRDIAAATAVAWAAGADAVTVDGAEGGSGWSPFASLDHVGLPLAECLRRIGRPQGCLLVSGRMWAGPRAVKALALGATAVGLGRAALIAADEDRDHGVGRLLDCLRLELRLILSALGKYRPAALDESDVWLPCDFSEPKERSG